MEEYKMDRSVVSHSTFDEADDHVYGPAHIVDYDQIQHQSCHTQPYGPGKALLRCPHILSSLVVHHPSRHDERRGIAGIDEDPDEEVNEESHDDQFRWRVIALEPSDHESN